MILKPSWSLAGLLALAAFIFGAIAGAAVLYFAPFIGMAATVDRLRPAAQAAEGWEDRFDQAETLRAGETADCRAAVAEERQSWIDHIAETATASARRCAVLNQEPTYDDAHCPSRELLRAGELHDSPAQLPGASTAGD